MTWDDAIPLCSKCIFVLCSNGMAMMGQFSQPSCPLMCWEGWCWDLSARLGVLRPRLGLGAEQDVLFLSVPLAVGVAAQSLVVEGACAKPDGPPEKAKGI